MGSASLEMGFLTCKEYPENGNILRVGSPLNDGEDNYIGIIGNIERTNELGTAIRADGSTQGLFPYTEGVKVYGVNGSNTEVVVVEYKGHSCLSVYIPSEPL